MVCLALYHVTAKEEVAYGRVFLDNQARELVTAPVRHTPSPLFYHPVCGLHGQDSPAVPFVFSPSAPSGHRATAGR